MTTVHRSLSRVKSTEVTEIEDLKRLRSLFCIFYFEYKRIHRLTHLETSLCSGFGFISGEGSLFLDVEGRGGRGTFDILCLRVSTISRSGLPTE